MKKVASSIRLRIEANLGSFDASFEEVTTSLSLSMAWIEYFWPISVSHDARFLLAGAKISIAESSAAWAIGANRGAAVALRAVSEAVLGWEYYKDHPIEYSMVISGRDDLILPKGIKSYLSKMDDGYDDAYTLLFKNSTRGIEYFYTPLSAFAHAHPLFAKYSADAAEAAISIPQEKSFLEICRRIDEFISDILLTRYRNHWDTVPLAVRNNAITRLDKKIGKFIGL